MCVWGRRLGVLSLTFILGVGSSALRNYRPVINVCDIDADNARYAGRTVRLHGYLSIDNGNVSVSSVCGSDSITGVNLRGAGVQLDPTDLKSFRSSSHTRDNETGYILYEVILVGTFDPPDGMLHCFSFKYHVLNAHVERVLSVKEFQGSNELFEWFKSKSH
jgi:hypothetical protein